MRKFINIFSNDEIIVEKHNVHNNAYYVCEKVFNKNKRITLKDFHSNLKLGSFIELNEDLLKKAETISIKSDILILTFYKSVITYPGLSISDIVTLSVHLELFSSNDIALFRRYCNLPSS